MECVDGYLVCYLSVSHPCIIPSTQHGDNARSSHVGFSHAGSSHADVRVPTDDVKPPPSPPHGEDDAQLL